MVVIMFFAKENKERTHDGYYKMLPVFELKVYKGSETTPPGPRTSLLDVVLNSSPETVCLSETLRRNKSPP